MHVSAIGVNVKSLIPVPVVDIVDVNHKLSIGLLNCQSVKNKATIISDFICKHGEHGFVQVPQIKGLLGI
jgi:hypothetical protein